MPWSIRGPPWRAARSLWGEAYRDAFPKGLHLGAVTVALDPSAGMNLAAMVAIAVAMFAVMPCLFMITFYICNRIQERTRPPPFCCLCCYNRIHPPAGFESVVVAGARDPREASASSSTTQRLSRTGRRSHSRTSFGSEAQRTGGSSAGPNNEAWHALEAAGSAAAGVAAPYSPENDVMMFEQDMSFDAAAAELMLISDPRRQALAMDNTGGRSRRVNSNGDAGLGWSSSSSSSGSMAGSVGRSSSNLAGGGWTGADGKGVYDGSSGGKVWATASGSPHGSRPGSAEFRASSPRYMPSSSGSTVSEV